MAVMCYRITLPFLDLCTVLNLAFQNGIFLTEAISLVVAYWKLERYEMIVMRSVEG